jgi:hypothetical protein
LSDYRGCLLISGLELGAIVDIGRFHSRALSMHLIPVEGSPLLKSASQELDSARSWSSRCSGKQTNHRVLIVGNDRRIPEDCLKVNPLSSRNDFRLSNQIDRFTAAVKQDLPFRYQGVKLLGRYEVMLNLARFFCAKVGPHVRET